MELKFYIHGSVISTEVVIWSSQMSLENSSIFPYLWVVFSKDGVTKWGSHSTRMRGSGISMQTISGGGLARGGVVG